MPLNKDTKPNFHKVYDFLIIKLWMYEGTSIDINVSLGLMIALARNQQSLINKFFKSFFFSKITKKPSILARRIGYNLK